MTMEHRSEERRNLHCCEVSFGETDLSIGFGIELVVRILEERWASGSLPNF